MKKKNKLLLEYVIISTIVVIFILAIIKFLGGNIVDLTTRTYCVITNKDYVKGDTVGEGKCMDYSSLK